MPKKILVVDDEPDLCDLISEFLKLEGFEVGTAGDGVEAFEILQKEPYDGVISDVRMPRKDGFGLLVDIKGSPQLKSIPVILISGFSDYSESDVIARGADCLLAKPEDLRHLAPKMKELLA